MANEPIITVVGNLVADPELRTSQAGNPWVTFRIASTPRVRDQQSGEWSDGEALFLGCRAYGDAAQNIAASLSKGTRIIAQGRLTQRSYTDNQGQQRTALDLEIEECGPALRWASARVTRGGGSGAAGGSAASYYGQAQAQPQAQAQQAYAAQPAAQQQSQPQAQQAWGQPAVPQQQQQAASPWNTQPQQQQQSFGSFDDEPTF